MSAKPALTREEESALIAAATAVREKASAPYSNFHVGAALLAEDGRLYTGCNVESPTYGLTCCAERTAVFKAISEGAPRRFRAVAVVTGADEPTPPCGACRQVMWDQCGDIHVVMGTVAGLVERTTLSVLFPRPFAFGGPE
jgi:cytidine deaminase